MTFDLLLRNARVIDPSQAIDGVQDVALKDGKVAAIGPSLSGDAKDVTDLTGLIVTPGLIDLHTHVYWGGTSLGIDADAFARASAVTTAIDTGSSGPGNYLGFKKHVIEKSTARVLVYLHVSFAGIFAFSNTIMVGESHDARLMAPMDAVRVAKSDPDSIVGIKVRIGRIASGPSGIDPLVIALQVADATGLPLMCHIDQPPPSYEAVVDMLRPGDVLTHCFRPFPNSPLNGDGSVKDAVLAARARGVMFDIGHGKGSFAWDTARGMIAQGFPPDVISSDIHQLNINGPVYDQVTTLSKFLPLGMSLPEIIRASTEVPAKAVRRADLGTLQAGSTGDVSILSLRKGSFDLEDVSGETVTVSERIFAEGCVIGGKWFQQIGRKAA